MQIKKFLSNPLVSGTLSLTAVGVFTRIIGFVFRVFLSKTIGEEGMGIYQLAVPVVGICMSVSALSLQTALSKLIASYSSLKNRQDAYLLRATLAASLCIAFLFMCGLFALSDWLCLTVLKEPRCSSLLRMLLLSLPFSCIHTCLCGYYFGHNQTTHPAFSQLIEQIARIGTILCIWYIRTQQGGIMNLIDIAAGSVIGEFASAVYLTATYLPQKGKKGKRTLPYSRILKELGATSLPLGGNRLCMTLLQTAESLLIPIQLRAYGMTSSQALSVFGVLTGMALPFIMFPSTLAHSSAVLLLPRIASDTASGSHNRVRRAANSNIRFCLYLGTFCLIFFLLTGPALGRAFFRSELAGTYIRELAWMSPFLYLNITCSSILNGLGKLSLVFFHNLSCLLLRIAGVILLVPRFGINGYLTGLLTSQILLCLMHMYVLHRNLNMLPQMSGQSAGK